MYRTILVGTDGSPTATEAVKAAPTGYDMVMGQKDNLVVGPWLYGNLPWDPTKDLVAVAHVAYTPVVIATAANSKFKTLAELLAYAKANPGKLNIGTPQVGTTQNLAAELFKSSAGITGQVVPFNGTPPVITALRDDLNTPAALGANSSTSPGGSSRWSRRRPEKGRAAPTRATNTPLNASPTTQLPA